MANARTILVTGATGMQGGATVDALLASGFSVRALARDPQSRAARALAERRVAVHQGSFDDPASLRSAMAGAWGTFSMQNVSPPNDPEAEIRHGRALVEAALAAGVEMFVHTSVARAGRQAEFASWAEGRWPLVYWNGKSGVNDVVRASRLPHWAIIKPAYMLENFLPPKAVFMYPGLKARGRIETAMAPDARLDVIAASDVGRMAAAAFADPARFDRQEIDLAVARLTMAEMAKAISTVTGKTVVAETLSPDHLVAKGYYAGLVDSQVWATLEGYRVDLGHAASFGVPLESPADWISRNRARFDLP